MFYVSVYLKLLIENFYKFNELSENWLLSGSEIRLVAIPYIQIPHVSLLVSPVSLGIRMFPLVFLPVSYFRFYANPIDFFFYVLQKISCEQNFFVRGNECS